MGFGGNFSYKKKPVRPTWFTVIVIIIYIMEIIVMSLITSIALGSGIAVGFIKKIGTKLNVILKLFTTTFIIFLQGGSIIVGIVAAYFMKSYRNAPTGAYWPVYIIGSALVPGFGYALGSELVLCFLYDKITMGK